MALLFFATFASEDLACISAGVLVAQGRLTYLMAVIACFFGIFAGDLIVFLVGRVFGGRAVNAKWFLRWIAQEKVSDARRWIQKRGASAVFISRFTPGLRVATYFSAGLLKMRWPKFILSLVAATAIWVPLVVSATELLGDQVLRHLLHNFGNGIIATVLSMLFLFLGRKVLPRRLPLRP